ncbi:MAG: prepilin-type N-terminal cleavage/methylation domain-containing protein [Planctomycetes bacterium]|nr:prepilin-type N-terminal cleavage/methylation domain-containing protein [Planctomycetota bacterium]
MQSLACLIRYMSFIKRQLNCAENNSRGLTAPGGKTHCARTFRGLLAPDYFDIRILELKRPVSSPRCGFTLVEFIVAMVVLGVALAGMFPLLIVQSRALESLELRYTEKGSEINQGKSWFSPVHRPYLGDNRIPRGERENYGVWYLIPADDAWTRKLGAAAKLTREYTEPIPPTLYVDDDDDGLNNDDDYVEESGSDWEPLGEGFQEDARRHAPAISQPAATWTFNISALKIPPGYYHVYATWPVLNPQALGQPNASFSVNGGNDVDVNQNLPPDGPIFQEYSDTIKWHNLTDGNPICVNDNTTEATVRITAKFNDDIGEYYPVAADAVLLVPVDNEVKVLSVVRSITSDATTARVKIVVNP